MGDSPLRGGQVADLKYIFLNFLYQEEMDRDIEVLLSMPEN